MPCTIDQVIERVGRGQNDIATLNRAAAVLGLPLAEARRILGEKTNRACSRSKATKQCRGKDSECAECAVGRTKLLLADTLLSPKDPRRQQAAL